MLYLCARSSALKLQSVTKIAKKYIETFLIVWGYVSDHISWQWLSSTVLLVCLWACMTMCMPQMICCTPDSKLILFLHVLKPFKCPLRGLRVDEVARRMEIALESVRAFFPWERLRKHQITVYWNVNKRHLPVWNHSSRPLVTNHRCRWDAAVKVRYTVMRPRLV
jgi:hypothetical protein